MSWIYTASSATRYSIVLTKVMLLHRYLYAYCCDDRFNTARCYVDDARNYEDILMNFVMAMKTKKGPDLVEVEGGVREWGGPRINDDDDNGGLSLIRKEHMKRRGECLGGFHRLIEEMPLRYRYEKVVDGVEEQGLSNKTGKLVYCDQQACERVFAVSSDERGRRERRRKWGWGKPNFLFKSPSKTVLGAKYVFY